MDTAVLFDGGGLARLGLEQAGHTCTGYELNPIKHYLSTLVGSGNCVLADVRDVDLSSYDAIWASPPCQEHSDQNHGNRHHKSEYADGDLLWWALALVDQYPDKVIWIENVINPTTAWGVRWNAAQFLQQPVQRRRRVVGGRYEHPYIFRQYKADYPYWRDKCPPAPLASELKQGRRSRVWEKERRKFTRWYWHIKGRMPTIDDMAAAQGFNIPPAWANPIDGYTDRQWIVVQSQALGNGVPVYMAHAFGAIYSGCSEGVRQIELFAGS